jgi:hypothetical protein
VGEDAVSGPGSGAFDAVDARSVPSVAAFQVADAALAADSPFHGLAERRSSFVGVPGLAGSALTGDNNVAHADVVQVVLDLFLAVAAVGGDGARCPRGAGADALDRRDQPRRVGCLPLSW